VTLKGQKINYYSEQFVSDNYDTLDSLSPTIGFARFLQSVLPHAFYPFRAVFTKECFTDLDKLNFSMVVQL